MIEPTFETPKEERQHISFAPSIPSKLCHHESGLDAPTFLVLLLILFVSMMKDGNIEKELKVASHFFLTIALYMI